MNQKDLETLVDRWLAAWTAQDADRLLSFYADEMTYIDPALRAPIHNKASFHRYLGRLFGGWQMTWQRRSVGWLPGDGEAALRWHATFKRPGTDATITADGMDYLVFKNELIVCNEVYFDRTVLASI